MQKPVSSTEKKSAPPEIRQMFRENARSATAAVEMTYGPKSFLIYNNGKHDSLSGDSRFRIAITPEDKEKEERAEHDGKTSEEQHFCTTLRIFQAQMDLADFLEKAGDLVTKPIPDWRPVNYSLLDNEPFDPLSDENFDPFADWKPDFSLAGAYVPGSLSLSDPSPTAASPTILNTSVEDMLANPDLELTPVSYALTTSDWNNFRLGTNPGSYALGNITPSTKTTAVADADTADLDAEATPDTATTQSAISATPPEGKTFSSAPNLETEFNAQAAGTSPYSLASPGAKLQPAPTYSLSNTPS
jgi:hypothetical protein